LGLLLHVWIPARMAWAAWPADDEVKLLSSAVPELQMLLLRTLEQQAQEGIEDETMAMSCSRLAAIVVALDMVVVEVAVVVAVCETPSKPIKSCGHSSFSGRALK